MAASTPEATSYDAAVAGWTTHLRSGGTTPWPVWLDQQDPGAPAATPARPRPDAAHLELARQINLVAGAPTPGLVDRVLATASPGRGLVDIPLAYPAAPRTYGTPAMDPGALPVEELIRLAVGVVVHLLPRVPAPTQAPAPAAWPLPWRRRFRLHGSPGIVASVRAGLEGQGLVESDWRPVHVVIARPVEVMMAEHWAASARAGGILKWSTLWRRAQAAGRLPGPIDVAGIAAGLQGRAREPVHVVVARDQQAAAETTARLLRARPFATGSGGDLAETDLLRRVNRLAALTAGPDRVRHLSVRLTAALDGFELTRAAPPVGAPRSARDWARQQAERTARHLRAAGYAVHGDPDELLPMHHDQSGSVDRTRTLELAVAACLRTWRLQEGTP